MEPPTKTSKIPFLRYCKLNRGDEKARRKIDRPHFKTKTNKKVLEAKTTPTSKGEIQWFEFLQVPVPGEMFSYKAGTILPVNYPSLVYPSNTKASPLVLVLALVRMSLVNGMGSLIKA